MTSQCKCIRPAFRLSRTCNFISHRRCICGILTMAVNEIRKGDFVYRDTLFVDPGGDRRHPRASLAELRDLLIPIRGHLPPEDRAAHWYEAQLLHYGLPRTKDKNTAKLRLVSAIAADSLAVPAYILQMETGMRKNFASRNRKAKTAANKPSEMNYGSNSKKRKAEAADDPYTAASSTRMSIRVGGVTVDIDHQGHTTNDSKKQKVALPAGSSSRSRVRNFIVPTTKRTAPKSTGTATSSRTATAQTAREGMPYNLPSSSPTPPKSEHSPSSIHDQYIKDEEIEEQDNPAYDPSPNDNFEVKPKPRVQVSGTYTITTPTSDTPSTLTLTKDRSTGQFWGDFTTASHRGVLHIADTQGMASQGTITFHWRAQDEWSGQLRFRRDQAGWIQFDGTGGVRGCWYGLLDGADLEFEGWLVAPPDTGVYRLMDHWEWFVKSAYGS